MTMGEWDTNKFKAGAHPYIDQYLKIASHGNVTAEYAIYLSRMRLACKVCHTQLTVEEPTGSELDYGIQEFVKIHAHTGGHNDKPIQTYRFEPLPPETKAVLETIANTSVGVLDLDKLKIETEMKKYDSQKKTDEALAKKIKQLQTANEQEIKVQELMVAGWDSFKEKGLVGVEEHESRQQALQSLREKQQMLENVLKIMEMKEKNAAIAGAISGHHIPPEPKREKPLRVSTGRKFR